MKLGTKIGLTAFAVCATAGNIALAAYGTARADLLRGSEEPKVLSLDNAALKEVTLEDFNLGQSSPDKKFRIEIDENRYILGAFIFNDCGRQSVGPTLGDAFTIDNTDSTDPNAYNFNILFSFEKSVGLDFTFDVESNSSDGTENVEYQMKYAAIGTSNFYTKLDETSYYALVTYPSDGAAANNFYDRGAYVNGSFVMDASKKSGGRSIDHENKNVVALQFKYHGNAFIKAGHKLDFTLTKLEFTYTCN